LRTQAFFDLLLLEIQNLQSIIEQTFAEAEKEAELIRNWLLQRTRIAGQNYLDGKET